MKKKQKLPVDGGNPLSHNPFENLSLSGLEAGHNPKPEPDLSTSNSKKIPIKNRGRLDIIRNTAHRGGKTVTVIKGFQGIGTAEIVEIAKKIQKTCGTGGTVKDRVIEIQGDRREEAARLLAEAGFKPVFAGG